MKFYSDAELGALSLEELEAYLASLRKIQASLRAVRVACRDASETIYRMTQPSKPERKTMFQRLLNLVL